MFFNFIFEIICVVKCEFYLNILRWQQVNKETKPNGIVDQIMKASLETLH